MANKDRQKRAARKARQAKRIQAEEAREIQAKNTQAAAGSSRGRSGGKASASQAPVYASKRGNAAPEPQGKAMGYFASVRQEMHRVVWPSPAELRSFTFAVIVLLIVFGIAVWLLDTGVVAGLFGYASLRSW